MRFGYQPCSLAGLVFVFDQKLDPMDVVDSLGSHWDEYSDFPGPAPRSRCIGASLGHVCYPDPLGPGLAGFFEIINALCLPASPDSLQN